MGSISSVMARRPLCDATTAACNSMELPLAFIKIASKIERSMKQVDLDEVPEYITKNRLWLLLKDHLLCARSIFRYSHITVLLLTLNDNTRLILKGCPASRVKAAKQQFAAELKIASSFPCHPLMTTVVGACEDEEGNMCLVTPYAGVSIATIIRHPDWRNKLSEAERTRVFAVLAAHTMTVHATLQDGDKDGCGYYYRDTKPNNMTYDPLTNQIKVIDYGLACKTDGSDHHCGYTADRLTPEMVDPANNFSNFYTEAGQKMALNPTTDVFLTGQQGIEMIRGLPKKLRGRDPKNRAETDVMLATHHSAGYPELIRRLRSTAVQDFLQQAMAACPQKRLTPADALMHPFLIEHAVAVQVRVEETLPEYLQQVCHILDILAPIQKQQGVWLASHHYVTQQQQQSEHRDSIEEEAAMGLMASAVAMTAGAAAVQDNSVEQVASCASHNSDSSAVNINIAAAAVSSDSSSGVLVQQTNTGSTAAAVKLDHISTHAGSTDNADSTGVIAAAAVTAAAAGRSDASAAVDVSKMRMMLTQRSKKLLATLRRFSKLSHRSMNKVSSGGKKEQATCNKAEQAVAVSNALAAADGLVVLHVEAVAVSVPGALCGFGCFGRSPLSVMAS